MTGRLLPLLLLAGCARPMVAMPADPVTDVELQTALFLDARSMESRLADDFACVSLMEGTTKTDPSIAVIANVQKRLGVPVHAGSRCTYSGPGDSVQAAGATGEGAWLTISKLACSDASNCTASVSYYVANLGAGGRDVTAQRRGGQWTITPTGAVWIS